MQTFLKTDLILANILDQIFSHFYHREGSKEKHTDENITVENILRRFPGIQHSILGWNDKELEDGLFVYVHPIHYKSCCEHENPEKLSKRPFFRQFTSFYGSVWAIFFQMCSITFFDFFTIYVIGLGQKICTLTKFPK